MAIKLSDLDPADALAAGDLLYILQNSFGKKVALSDILKESNINFSDITTGDVSALKHGFVPKAPNQIGMFLNGMGEWVTPSGSTVIEGATLLDPGASWSDFTTAYAAAPSGGLILLPNTTIAQTAGLVMTKAITIRGTGPLSGFSCNVTPTLSGSGRAFAIGESTIVPSFKFEDFIYTVGVDAGRFDPFVLSARCQDVYFRNISFTNVKANCIVMNQSSPGAGPLGDGYATTRNIYIENCTVNGHWESFFLLIQGSVWNLNIIGNTTFTDDANPTTSVSRPSGVFIDYEFNNTNGQVVDCTVSNNHFEADISGADFQDSIGYAIRINGTHPDFKYHHCSFLNNTVSGFDKGALIGRMQSSTSSLWGNGACFNTIAGNLFQHCGNLSVWFFFAATQAGGIFTLADNDIEIDAPEKVVGAIRKDSTGSGLTILESPANRITNVF